MEFSRWCSYLVCSLLATGCHCVKTTPSVAASPLCTTLEAPLLQASLDDPQIGEASGLVASHQHPGIGWTHNDSGDGPRLFAIEFATGDTVASFELAGIEAVDWEDISLSFGEEDAAPTIYIADTGDNFSWRDHVKIHRFEEPRELVKGGVLRDIETMIVQYPDGPHDVECLAALPNGTVVLFSKTLEFSSTIYSVGQWHPGGVTMANIEGTVDLMVSGSAKTDRVTGCDVSPENNLFVLRTYGHVFIFDNLSSITAPTLAQTIPCVAALPKQEQGEAIAVSATSPPHLFVISEDVGEPIWKIPLRLAPRSLEATGR